MSAIYGKLSFSGTIGADTADRMKSGYADCKIDRYSAITSDNVLMGCAEQFLIDGSEGERFPYEDERYLFVSDGMMDDKEALAKELGLDESAPDGLVLFTAIKKWKFEFGEHLYGAFSACLYDKKEKKMFLFTDHVGSRCVYYRKTEDAFFFSTLVTPIINATDDKIELSEKWISYWGLNCSPSMYILPDLSPFEGIYQLEPHRVLVVDATHSTVEKVNYWDPYAHIKEYKVSDEEGLALFRETISDCIRKSLRANGETAVTLSSGLDSSTIACLASRILSERGKKLYSFTSVPLKDFNEEVMEGRVADETEGVMEIVAENPDIVPEFLSCPGKNAIKDAYPLTKAMEAPYKATSNTVWMDEVYKQAAAKGCHMLFTGQSGNGTISYGFITNTIYRLVIEGHIKRAVKEFNTFAKTWRYPRKRLLKDLAETFYNTRIASHDYMNGRLTPLSMLKKYDAKTAFNENMKILGNMQMDKKREQLAFMWSDTVYNNLSMYETKLGLRYGIFNRDITRHPRVINVIAGLPITCTAGGGLERRLVRAGMKGIVPRSTRLNMTKRGLQGADLTYRMEHADEATFEEAYKRVNDKAVEKYIDPKVLEEIRNLYDKYKFDRHASDEMKNYTYGLFLVCVLSAFIEHYER